MVKIVTCMVKAYSIVLPVTEMGLNNGNKWLNGKERGNGNVHVFLSEGHEKAIKQLVLCMMPWIMMVR